MISPTETLSTLEPTYRPNQAISESLRAKCLIALIGASAVGKTTLIRAISGRHPSYSEVVSFTTRPPRGPADTYRFIERTNTNLAALSAKASRGELVNFSVHPTTGHVYGTETEDYKTDRCMLATTSKSFESDKHLPFSRVVPIVVVAAGSAWLARIRERSASEQELTARLSEARQSLLWSLDQDDTYFADNTPVSIGATADHIVADIETGTASSPLARNLAYDMLRVAEV